MRPSVMHHPFKPTTMEGPFTSFEEGSKESEITPNQLRWSPMKLPSSKEKITFVEGIHGMCMFIHSLAFDNRSYSSSHTYPELPSI